MMKTKLSDADRTLAMLAHLSGLAGYVVPFGGAVVPLCMMLMLADRPQVAALARQALLLNVAIFGAAILAIAMVFTIVLIPLSWAIAVLLTPVAVLLPIIGAVKAANGEVFRYPVVGAYV
jgi:uncharacterized Tic20 family protein